MMKYRMGLGVALMGAASFCACGGRTSSLEDSNGGAAGAGSGVAGKTGLASAGASNVAGASERGGSSEDGSSEGGFAQGGFAQGGGPRGFAGAAPSAGAGGFAGGGVAGGPPSCSMGLHSGGYVNPCLSAGDAGSGGASDECRAFDLVGAYWNGTTTGSCIEPVDDVSATSGVGIERGTLGDLHTWSEQFVETEDGLRVGAIGMTVNGTLEFHLLELATGISTSVPVAHLYSLAGVLSTEPLAVVGAYISGNSLLVDLINPLTGAAERVATITGVTAWGTEIVLDHARNHVYALADSSSGSSSLYDIDLSDGSSSSQPLPWSGYIGGVTTNGQIVGMSKVASNWTVSTIDPTTNTVTQRGTLTDFGGGSAIVYDPTLNVAHTVSTNAQGVNLLYSLDLASGAETQVEVKHGYVLAKQ